MEKKKGQNVPQTDKVDDESLDKVTNGGTWTEYPPKEQKDTKNKFD